MPCKHNPREGFGMMGKRRWLGLRVWIADAEGKNQNGTLWRNDETSVLIRENGRPGLLELPKAAQGRVGGSRRKATRCDGER